MAKYKIGVIKNKGDNTYVNVCSCGEKWDYQKEIQSCSKCGNRKFLAFSIATNRMLIPYLEVLHKDSRGFKIKRTNLSVILDENCDIKLKRNQVQVMLYDLVNKKIDIWKNGEKLKFYGDVSRYPEISNYQRFFHQVDEKTFLDLIKTPETAELYEFAWKELSSGKSYYSSRKIYKGLVKLFNYEYMQILSSAGFPNIKRFKENVTKWTKDPTLNTRGTNPKEIFGLPKFLLRHFRENQSIGLYEIKQLKSALKKIESNKFKECFEIVKDEGSDIATLCNSIDDIIVIHNEYGYNNLKKLILYLFREIRMTQGITSARDGANLLRDYLSMSVQLGQEYEKYPKSLKKEHDIIAMNYKVRKDEQKQEEFSMQVESDDYKELELKTKEYSIISPKTMDDLIKEGSELSHCVASYVNSVIKNDCKIYFLRMTEEVDKPYATIEVRGDRIRQCRGFANRKLNGEEKDFISGWAKKNELVESYYY